MERIDLDELGHALAIYAPWKIASFEIDNKSKVIDVKIEHESNKRTFKFFKNTKKNDDAYISAKWQYISVGTYKCMIHANIEESLEQEVFNTKLFSQPAFIGHSKRNYSNYIRQQVCLAHTKGTDVKSISSMLKLDESLVKTIVDDLNNSPENLQVLSYLACEFDQVWNDVLLDKKTLSTKILPLKFLMSKLKLDNSQSTYDRILTNSIQLKSFFIANANLLQNEMLSLADLDQTQQKSNAQSAKNKLKLVLPNTNNAIWKEILLGDLSLNSNDLALNLLISRLRNNTTNFNSDNWKLSCTSLYQYFRKNYRNLKSELILINKELKIKKSPAIVAETLPNPSHEIWQNVIDSDDFLISDHMAFNLLLARLRMQLYSKINPVGKLEAAKRIYAFVNQNQKMMHKEFKLLSEYSRAA